MKTKSLILDSKLILLPDFCRSGESSSHSDTIEYEESAGGSKCGNRHPM